MRYLLDTCIVSELINKKPEKSVLNWMRNHDELSFFLSVITFGELEKGIGKLDVGGKKWELRDWVDNDLKKRFYGRILPVDFEVASKWGQMASELEKNGTPIPVLDGLISATAYLNGMVVVTRNTTHIEKAGVTIINPWDNI